MASRPVFKAGNVALITGAASKIGFEVAKLCSGHGMRLVLVDQDSTGLYQTRLAIGGAAGVRCLTMDVSKADHWAYIKLEVNEFCGTLDFLFLNENLHLPGDWQDKFKWHKMMGANAFAIMEGVSLFLPDLRRKTTSTAIVITGSTESVSNSLRNAAYAASKAAVEAFAEPLHEELQPTSTSVHLLVPCRAFDLNETMSSSSFCCEKLGAKFLQEKMLVAKLRIECPGYVFKVNETCKRKSRSKDKSEDSSEYEAPISKRLRTKPRD